MTHMGIGFQSPKGCVLLCAGKISLELFTPFCVFFSYAMKGRDVNGKALTTLLRH